MCLCMYDSSERCNSVLQWRGIYNFVVLVLFLFSFHYSLALTLISVCLLCSQASRLDRTHNHSNHRHIETLLLFANTSYSVPSAQQMSGCCERSFISSCVLSHSLISRLYFSDFSFLFVSIQVSVNLFEFCRTDKCHTFCAARKPRKTTIKTIFSSRFSERFFQLVIIQCWTLNSFKYFVFYCRRKPIWEESVW